jgi:radical SAM enzyme (TIGR01210 family)
MSNNTDLLINDNWIVASRGNKNHVDPLKPYGWLVEKERTVSGSIEDTGIIFLTNRECPFHCLMCDLWKNTTDVTATIGTIPDQIRFAMEKMPAVRHIKLYNSGSFFDTRAIPEEDYKEIASLLKNCETVIVESHPRLINEKCVRFRDMLVPVLHVAMGLETVNREILSKLNKQMTPEDFSNSAGFLTKYGIYSRAFILLGLPLLTESESIFWAERSIDFAFTSGVECCTIIPVREGNGAMDLIKERGDFTLPDILSLEKVLEYGIGLNKGRVFADVWDLAHFSKCDKCIDQRIKRVNAINLSQKITSTVDCNCNLYQT